MTWVAAKPYAGTTVPLAKAAVNETKAGTSLVLYLSETLIKKLGFVESAQVDGANVAFDGEDEARLLVTLLRGSIPNNTANFKTNHLAKGGIRIFVEPHAEAVESGRETASVKIEEANANTHSVVILLPLDWFSGESTARSPRTRIKKPAPPEPVSSIIAPPRAVPIVGSEVKPPPQIEHSKKDVFEGLAANGKLKAVAYLRVRGYKASALANGLSINGESTTVNKALVIINDLRKKSDLPPLDATQIDWGM